MTTVTIPPMKRTAILIMLLFAVGCECREITTRQFRVLRVVDGDTFKVEYDGESTSVRFFGINAPEKRDPDGPAATAALVSMIYEQMVRLEFSAKRKRDNFGRLLCKVYLGDVDVGKWMVEHGHAVRYTPKR
jgi:micrococcal nuclease